MLALDAQWLARLHASADQPAATPRWPLFAGGGAIGSISQEIFKQIERERGSDLRSLLLKIEHTGAGPEGHRLMLQGQVQPSLNALAQLLRDLGLTGRWRNEHLAVCRANGMRVATIERAACRVLGIATRAVHLVGITAEGRIWVQQRSHDKATDPGLWDTLMGGMVSAADNLSQALARETTEEAGLQLPDLLRLRAGGRVAQRRPAPADTGGDGWIDEVADWFVAELPLGIEPVNQDGEVAGFELMQPQAVHERLVAGQFTLEASLILAQHLQAS